MPRTPLSRGSIVDAAFDVLADDGIDGLTARALAGRLGVRAGALYYHVRDMRDLRDEMATRITREMLTGMAATNRGWRDLLESGAHRIRRTLLAYRDGAALVSGTLLTDDDVLALLEAPLALLVSAGLDPVTAQRALTIVNSYVTGFVAEEQFRRPAKGLPSRLTAQARRSRLDPDAQPLSYALSDEVAEHGDDTFTWGVAVILDGIAAHIS